ncbi:Novel Sm-like protein with long N-and C-terminal domains [Ectocarpus siliculosus]|uniref:Novel Sm-like protein with long N-and C-terminal domains n=1 Tax=Ectocarpus siliculosus TaxID=2880 RepID=D8LRU5_ECTSI|nr:Novel Sm-like protein with long N-and C-terminal domains [Ectocarpus siliculosus]|eukprot:CBN73862.1 Novel Sm-like protein with long N-and C-terminal domains [Ectocarpus siliculosus]
MAEEGSGVPLVGSRISLISKKNIRYEGTLYNINTSDASLALQNVRSFGTEGRVEGHVIPPSQVLHDFVCFRGQDIMDLHVHDAEADEGSQAAPPPPPTAPVQFAQPPQPTGPPPPSGPPPLLSPAFVSLLMMRSCGQGNPDVRRATNGPQNGPPARQQATQAGQRQPAPSARPVPVARGAQQRRAAPASSSPRVAQAAGQAAQQNQRRAPTGQRPPPRSQQHQHPSQPTGAPRGRRNGTPRSRQLINGGGAGRGAAGGTSATSAPARTPGAMVGTGEALLNIRARGGPATDGKGAASVPTAQEFDFQSELQKFDKEKELAKEMGGLSVEASNSTASSGGAGGATDSVKKYNKSSFFDEISCDVLDRAAGRQPRVTRAAEMDMNMDTFGTTGLQHARRRGGRGHNRNKPGGGGAGGGGQGTRGGVGAGRTGAGGGAGTANGGRGGGGGGRGGAAQASGGGGRARGGGGGRGSTRGGYAGGGRGGAGQARPKPKGGRGRGGNAPQGQQPTPGPTSAPQAQAV